jgi:hypothetical protein
MHAVSLIPVPYRIKNMTPHARVKKALARESGAQGGIIWWKKTESRKSHDTVPVTLIY